MKDSNKRGTSLGTILTIALAGAAIGAMFIPYRRNEVRSKVVAGAQDLADYVTEKLKYTADEIVTRTERLFDKQKSNAEKLAGEAKNQFEKAKNETNQDFNL